jgi:DTW domain-containing protein YfiP
MCYRCFKPQITCVCATVRMVDNRTGVIIIQHPRERNHPIGTERFARLGLKRVQIHVRGPWEERAGTPPPVLQPNTALLYPSPGARDLAEIPASERPDHVVVIDGTWGQARTMMGRAPWLAALPRVRLTPAAPSEYRIRREPKLDYISTIEATVATLKALEPETVGLDGLIDAFRHMIDRQIEVTERAGSPRIRAPRAQRSPVPRAFAEDYQRLVLVYGEAQKDQFTLADGSFKTVRDLVYWCAIRPATGETFERYIRPARARLKPEHVALMGLSIGAIEAGIPATQFAADWDAFVGSDSRVGAWNPVCVQAAAVPQVTVLLKGVARNLTGERCGHLADFAAAQGLSLAPTPFKGRTAEQLGYAVAVAQSFAARAGAHKKP